MPERPDVNDRFPLRESLSPPLIAHPVFECAGAVYVTGFMAHARVRVFANLSELLAEDEPPFGFAQLALKRPVKVGESLSATQEVEGQISAHSSPPMMVLPLDGDRIRTTVPDVIEPLYECSQVVPVGNLVPSTRVHVFENGAQVGQEAASQTFHAVLTQPLKAGSQVTAVAVACEGSDHEIKGPTSAPAAPPPLAAPSPMPAPSVDPASLIPGNDVVTLTGLLVGASIEIFDQGVLVSSGWLATAGANWFPLTTRLSSTPITATQALCGKVSPPSAPVIPAGRLNAPLVLGPICEGAHFVVIRGSAINATVVVLRNGAAMTHGGAAPGDLVLQLGQNATLSSGDVISAVQYMNGTLSASSPPITVTSGLAAPAVEILGGEPFFLARASETPIPGPVFPRGRGAGPLIRIQACCTREVKAWVTGPHGDRLADLALDQLYPGYYQAQIPWSALGAASPERLMVGEYLVHVRSGCSEREAAEPFYLIFDPVAAGGPPRFAFDSTAVWFGTGVNSIRGLHYYLHCSDWTVFRIAIGAVSGQTDPYSASSRVARAEEALFDYSLDYHTQDVADLIANYAEAQCADDAACLTALLRAVGIPAHPVTADAALETGAAYWTFDTWVEFLAKHDGSSEWRIFHPHEHPGMSPEARSIFGLRSVANKGFNDLIVMANESWPQADLDDGNNDVSYGRNDCGEPNQAVTRAAWVDELCEAGYWAQPHWDCAGVQPHSLVPGDNLRLNDESLVYGGRLSGDFSLVSPLEGRAFGRLVVELVTHRLESKAFVEDVLHTSERFVTLERGESITVPIEIALPRTLAPGRELYLRAHFNERTALLTPLVLPPLLNASLKIDRQWDEGQRGAVEVCVVNISTTPLRDVTVSVKAPYALAVERRHTALARRLEPGQEQTFAFSVQAIAELPSGSLHVAVATKNGGGLLLRQPFRIAPRLPSVDAWPGLHLLVNKRPMR